MLSRLLMLIVLATSIIPASVHSQTRGVVSGVVVDAGGGAISNSRVRIISGAVDTTLRTTANGTFALVLALGRAKVVATMIGYQPYDEEIEIVAVTTLKIELQSVPYELGAVRVLDSWTGIRGVVGDDRTMAPLSGVEITSMSRGIRVLTDSQGRFQFSLPKAERTTLQLSLPNYLTRPAVVSMDGVKAADVTLLMTQGADPIHMRSSLSDLSHRMSWGGIKMFVAGPEQLSRHGAKNLADGIRESGLLARKGIEGGGCLFVNGVPQPNMGPGQIPIAAIEFVEVWGFNSEQMGTLAARWPGGSCSGGRRRGKNGDGPWISVWLRR